MANLELPPFSILLFLFLLPISCYTAKTCPLSICGNNTFTIKFPFQLQSQDPNCTYPGFELICNDDASTLINLAQSGDFFVNEINYVSQSIQIRDPDNCLPSRFLDTFDTSGSPFKVVYTNYTFVRCPRDLNTTSRFVVIECLSNSTRSVLAIPSKNVEDLKSLESCEKIAGDLPVPSSWPEEVGGTSVGFNDEVQLKWDVPDCRGCVARGEVCGFKSNNSLQVECSVDPSPDSDTNRNGPASLTIFRIIALSIAVPAFTLSVCIGVFLCYVDTRRANRRRNIAINTAATNTATAGLDQSTIDTYTKVVLGESRRVPGLNDGTCPICLSDYNAKEALRFIPECQHCFHADCLDEWLRLNGTCPICRTSPPHDVV